MTTARIEISDIHGSGGRKGFWKLVTGVDTTKANGYAFDGRFLNAGQHDLAIGSVVICKTPTGSAKRPGNDGELYVVTADGLSDRVCSHDWGTEFLSFRDAVAKQLATDCEPTSPAIDLSQVPLELLRAEIARREAANS